VASRVSEDAGYPMAATAADFRATLSPALVGKRRKSVGAEYIPDHKPDSAHSTDAPLERARARRFAGDEAQDSVTAGRR